MSDDFEIPVEEVAHELLSRKGGRRRGKTAASAPDRVRSGEHLVNPAASNAGWMQQARVIDLEAFARLREAGLGAKRISKALGCTQLTAQKLMNRLHWQQDPVKVRLFNQMRGGSVDPETGMPTADDLAKFGGPLSKIETGKTKGDQDLRQIVKAAGVSQGLLDETMRGLRLLSGAMVEGDLPDKVDTKWLQDSADVALGRILTLLRDPAKLAGASLADLTRAGAMLFEKRALLRGEPTAIVRNEQRGSLDAVAALLLKEVERRGITLDLAKGPGGYQEVQS